MCYPKKNFNYLLETNLKDFLHWLPCEVRVLENWDLRVNVKNWDFSDSHFDQFM